MPVPGGLNNLFQFSELRLPAQFAANFLAAGYEGRRIARPTRADLSRSRFSSNPASGFDHVADTESLAVAKVVHPALPVQGMQGQDMARAESVT